MGTKFQTTFDGETMGDQPMVTAEEAVKFREKERQQKKEKIGVVDSIKEKITKTLEDKKMAVELPTPNVTELWEFQKGLLDLQKEGQKFRAEQLQILQEAGENLAIVSKNQQGLYDAQKEEIAKQAKFYLDVQAQLTGASQARTINSFVEWGKTLFIVVVGCLGYLKLSQVSRDVQDIRRKQ